MSETTTDFQTIGLLGVNSTGASIAYLFAASGRKVVVLAGDNGQIESGISAVAAILDIAVAQGTVSVGDAPAILSRIVGTTSASDLSGVDAVLETGTDAAEVTLRLAAVAAVVDPRTPLLISSSALSITDIAAALPNPGRVAGLHFVDCAAATNTVEVVHALQTGEGVIDALVALVDTLDDKVAVVVKDRPGFLIDALLAPYLNDVVQEYDNELATAEDLDIALELGLGYKVGPMKMLDHIGLDVHLATTEAIYRRTLDSQYAPPPLLRQMVAAGQLGDKSGHGFRTQHVDQQESN